MKDVEKEKIMLGKSSLLNEDQYCNMDLLAKVTSLEIHIKEQQGLLNTKDSQLNIQAETIRNHERKLQEKQDVIKEKQDLIVVLERKNRHLEGVFLQMETVVEKSNCLQDKYLETMTKLQAKTQEQTTLLDDKDDQLNAQSLKLNYLSNLCGQAQEAMDENKATIANLEYDVQDLETTIKQQKADLEECKQSLFTTNQIITLTEQRDSYMKIYVRRLASYYQNKEEQRRSCFPLKIFGYRRQQSPAASIVNKLAQVLLLEEQN